MKVLLVSQYYWPESFPINAITRSMAERGHEVLVLTGQPNYPQGRVFPGYHSWHCGRQTHDGVNIQRIPLAPRGRSALGLAINYLSFVVTGALLAPWHLRRQRADIIFVYAPSPILQALPAILLGRLWRRPVVLWVQDLWPESLSATGYVKNKIVLAAVAAVVRFIYHHVQLLLVQSEAFIETVRQLAGATPVIYHPNSADECFAEPLGEVATPDIPALDGGFVVMFTGNLGTAQAVDVIVEVAELLKEMLDIRFVILGDGSRKAWMEEQVKQRGLTNLHLAGRFPMETMPGLMRRADALLVTLASQPIFAQTVPSKVQAYLACGKPIVASLDGEGARLVVQAGAGLAVPAEDAASLADAIVKLYRMSPEELVRMGSAGRECYERQFRHGLLVERLLGHLQDTLQRVKK
jgi:glycosyltransferase involved in cell wall biosynthesis